MVYIIKFNFVDQTCKTKRKKLESTSAVADCNKSSQKKSNSNINERVKLCSGDDLRIVKKSKKKNKVIKSTEDESVFFTFDRTPDKKIVAMLNASSSSSGKEIDEKKAKKLKEKKTKRQFSCEDAGSSEGEIKKSKMKKSKRKRESSDDDGNSSKKKKPKTKKSKEESRDEDLFSVGESEIVGGSLVITGGQRTMNKKMKELAAVVKVSDIKRKKQSKTISIGLDDFFAENTATEELSKW